MREVGVGWGGGSKNIEGIDTAIIWHKLLNRFSVQASKRKKWRFNRTLLEEVASRIKITNGFRQYNRR